jgi:hypothetical protein
MQSYVLQKVDSLMPPYFVLALMGPAEAVKNIPYNLLWKKMITQNMDENFPFQAKNARATAEGKSTPHHGSVQGAAVFLYRNNAVVF